MKACVYGHEEVDNERGYCRFINSDGDMCGQILFRVIK